MKLDIFQGFQLKTMLFDYDSFQFRRMFRGAGSFSLTLNDLTEKENLMEDTIIIARNDAWIIENVHGYKNIRGEMTLELSGRHINAILERRVVESFTVNTTDTIETQLRQLITVQSVFGGNIAKPAEPVNGQDERRINAQPLTVPPVFAAG